VSLEGPLVSDKTQLNLYLNFLLYLWVSVRYRLPAGKASARKTWTVRRARSTNYPSKTRQRWRQCDLQLLPVHTRCIGDITLCLSNYQQLIVKLSWQHSHRVSFKKTGRFVISSYLCFDSYESHENFQKYTGGVACCEYGINVCDSLTIPCQYRYNETTENYHVNKHKTRFLLMQDISLCGNKTQH